MQTKKAAPFFPKAEKKKTAFILSAVTQLLGLNDTKTLRLAQSDLWAKYGHVELPEGEERGTYENTDQRVHVDFPNHNLAVPMPDWSNPCGLEMIIYYSDGDKCDGATAVIPRPLPANEGKEKEGGEVCGESGADGSSFFDPYGRESFPYLSNPGFGPIPWFNDRKFVENYFKENHPEKAEFRSKLYEREKKVAFNEGTILFYRFDTWHRGRPVNAGEVRYTQNMAWRKSSCEWITHWNSGVARKMYEKDMKFEKWMARATVEQRNVLGFPPPGHEFWNPVTFEGVRRRYEPLGMDMSPYAL